MRNNSLLKFTIKLKDAKVFYLFICINFFLGGGVMGNPEYKFLPEDNKTLVIIGQDIKTIEEYVNTMNIIPAGFMVYTSIQNMDGLFQASKDYGAGVNHAQYLIQKYPNTIIQLGLYMVDALEGVLGGQYDENIKELARWIKEVNVPVYLRIGYEFDGPHNHYDPGKYKKAYIYIVEMLREQKIDNIAYVWHSQGFLNENKDIMDWYPGDEYVDWFGISYFHLYYEKDRIAIAALAKEHNKPLMIAEATPYGLGNKDGKKTWTRWFEKVFQFIEQYDVGMLCYIDTNWDIQQMWKGQGWGDARIQENSYMRNEWLKEIQTSRYLHSSAELYDYIKCSRSPNLPPN